MKKQSNAMRIKDAARAEEGTGNSEDMAGGMKVGGGGAVKRQFQAQGCEKNGYSNSDTPAGIMLLPSNTML
jgi:hypothetical protein